jgi:hypothetical protein
MATIREKETSQTQTYLGGGNQRMGEKEEEDWTDRNNWRRKLA